MSQISITYFRDQLYFPRRGSLRSIFQLYEIKSQFIRLLTGTHLYNILTVTKIISFSHL